MTVGFWASVLWAVDFGLNLVLVFVLFYKRRYRTVPWFTAWITVEAVYTAALFLIFRLSSHAVYAVAYWTADFLDVALQLAVIWEIARYVLRRFGSWVEGARLRLGLMAAVALTVAGMMAWKMTPAAETRLDSIAARSSLFTTIVVCLLLTAVILLSQRLGLALRSHVMRESYGFILWSLVAFVTDSLHAYWRTMGHFTLLENTRIGVFQASLIYWCVVFWRPEPKRVELSNDAEVRLTELASRLGYGEPGNTRSGGAE